ncbi:MAG: hypothetical protein H6722_13470 [Sandaracinus sp.]|nr:hypothetical protein [Sandaracinus sp.]MCB9613453.1 hypothetical protein [Sandaracinus sp.]MCB9621553.1 hypothetical protein [Sandaracinus sp.]
MNTDQGWFVWLAERAKAKAASTSAADEAATGDWLSEAWAHVADPVFVAAVYAKRASLDPTLAEELERCDARSPECVRVMIEAGARRVGPYLVSRLGTDTPHAAYARLGAGVDVGRPLVEALAPFPDVPVTLALASSSYAVDRRRAVEVLREGRETDATVRVAMACAAYAGGEDDVAPFVLEALDTLVAQHDGGEGPFDRDGGLASRVFAALLSRPLPEAAPASLRLLRSPDVVWASLALSGCAREEDAPAMAAYLRTVAGPLRTTAAFRCGVENALARFGHPRTLDAARTLRALGVERYGYPKQDDLVVLHRLAADAFRNDPSATDEERAWVRSLRSAPFALLRDAARLAGGAAPDFWDAPRVKAVAEREGVDPLIASLGDATFASAIYAFLTTAELDPVSRARVTAIARERLERVPNPRVHSDSELDPDAKAAVRFLGALPGDEKASLASSTSAWIRAFVTETEKLEREPRAPRPGAHVTRLDVAPFAVGKKINGLALSPDDRTLVAVGDETAAVLDAESGAFLRRLETTWRWGYDVAFSPDGALVASAWHGGHVDVHEVASGARHVALEGGHAGVPSGVRSVAWSMDGRRLFTGGDDGRLVAWDVASATVLWSVVEPGGFHAITPLDDGSVIASHVKTGGGETNWVARFDAAGAELERVDTKTSIWTIAWRGDVIAVGGEDRRVKLFDATKGLKALGGRALRTIESKQTTRLRWDGDTLLGASATGTCFVAGPDGEHHAKGDGAYWALAGRFVGGDGGVVERLGEAGPERPASFAHSKKIVAVVPYADDVVAVDWDGSVGRFDAAGKGRLLVALGGTPESAVRRGDELVVGMRDGVRVVDLETGVVRREVAGRHDDVVLDRSERLLACSRGGSVVFREAQTLAPIGDPVMACQAGVNALAWLPDGRLVVGSERGELAMLSPKGGAWARSWYSRGHGGDRVERGNPHCDVCSIVASKDGRRFVSGATDHTVRVWSTSGPELTLRISEDVGLFNRLALDDEGCRLAIPTGGGLFVYDLDAEPGTEEGEDLRLMHREPWSSFGSQQLTVAAFVGARELVVGTESGGLFRVSLGGK